MDHFEGTKNSFSLRITVQWKMAGYLKGNDPIHPFFISIPLWEERFFFPTNSWCVCHDFLNSLKQLLEVNKRELIKAIRRVPRRFSKPSGRRVLWLQTWGKQRGICSSSKGKLCLRRSQDFYGYTLGCKNLPLEDVCQWQMASVGLKL